MAPTVALLTIAWLTATLASAQEAPQTADAAAQRVLQGGTFFEPKWRRGGDGMLELEYFADSGLPERAHFVPLLGEDLAEGLQNCGVIGWLSLWCHGNGDLLSMTDAGFHLGCLGIDTTDVGLRQYLARPLPPFDGQRGQAEMFDRMLAIDLLLRRGCMPAEVELKVLATNRDATAALRERALAGIAALHGAEAPQPRRRLDPGKLMLPAAFDGCVVIDHQRLPDLGWLTGFGRRLGMLVTARTMIAAGGSISPAACNGAQRFADVVGELPFGVALRCGNMRLDHSCFVITAKADEQVPVAVAAAASGSFDAGRLQAILKQLEDADANPLAGSRWEITNDLVQESSDGSTGKARPEMAAELLRDTGAAIRVVVPQNSKLWLALAFLQLPPARAAELQVTFGDVGRLLLTVTARDEDAAEAWVEKGKALLAQGKAELGRELRAPLQQSQELQLLFDALFGAAIAADGDKVTATVEVKGFDRHKLAALFEKIRM